MKKKIQLFDAVVEQQEPAINDRAQFIVVGQVSGTHSECWEKAKAMVPHPAIRFIKANQ